MQIRKTPDRVVRKLDDRDAGRDHVQRLAGDGLHRRPILPAERDLPPRRQGQSRTQRQHCRTVHQPMAVIGVPGPFEEQRRPIDRCRRLRSKREPARACIEHAVGYFLAGNELVGTLADQAMVARHHRALADDERVLERQVPDRIERGDLIGEICLDRRAMYGVERTGVQPEGEAPQIGAALA